MWPNLFVRQLIMVCCLLLLSLVGCTPDGETVEPGTRRTVEASPRLATATMPLAEPSPTVVTATIAATAAATATLVPAFTPTAAAAPATIAPTEAPVIAPESEEEVTQLARLGQGRIDGVSWSPDGKLIAVSGYHGIDLYDAPTLQLIYTIDAQGPYGSSLSFSPQGDAGELLYELEGHTSWILDLVFSPDGRLLAVVNGDGSVQLWGLSDGTLEIGDWRLGG